MYSKKLINRKNTRKLSYNKSLKKKSRRHKKRSARKNSSRRKYYKRGGEKEFMLSDADMDYLRSDPDYREYLNNCRVPYNPRQLFNKRNVYLSLPTYRCAELKDKLESKKQEMELYKISRPAITSDDTDALNDVKWANKATEIER